jgi:Concanavalin A-like lectin/glucanases superfamily
MVPITDVGFQCPYHLKRSRGMCMHTLDRMGYVPRWLLILFFHLTLAGLASASTCVQPPAGLVSWWPAEGTTEDIIGEHDGSLQGGATFTTGAVGQAFSFDGIDDTVMTDVILPSVGTLEFWVNPASLALPASTQILLGTHGLANGDDRLWMVSGGPSGGPGVAPNTMVVNLGSCCVNDLVIANPLSAGIWTHLALTFDYTADTYMLYVNGVLAASSTAPRTAPTQALRIGGATSNFGQDFFFHGALDEVSLYNRVLSSSEITAIVAAGSLGKCQTPGSCIGTGDAFLGGRVIGPTGALVPGVMFTLDGSACHTTSTSAIGLYLFPYLDHATYTVRPNKVGCVFTPVEWTGPITKRLALVPFVATCP